MMKVFVDEAFQFTLCMLDFRILGFYVRPPESPVTLEPTGWQPARPIRNVSFGKHLGGADSTGGLALRDT